MCLDGKGGGLTLFVSEDVSLNLLNYGVHHIDTTVTSCDGNKVRYTFVYGETCPHDSPEFWKLFRRIKDKANAPWLVAGDLNKEMYQSEHWSATRRNESRMRDFRNCINFCNLLDLGYVGCPWTFDNKQEGSKNVRVQLDRAMACPAWSQLFPNHSVQHPVSSASNHCPILIRRDNVCNTQYRQHRYDQAMWERVDSLGDCIEETWKHLRPAKNLESIQAKLSNTMESMVSWRKLNFALVNRRIAKLKRKLENLQKGNYKANRGEIKAVSAELDEILHREEIMWRQRSRMAVIRRIGLGSSKEKTDPSPLTKLNLET